MTARGTKTTTGNFSATVKALLKFPTEAKLFKSFKNVIVKPTETVSLGDGVWDGGTRSMFYIMCFYKNDNVVLATTARLDYASGERDLSVVTDCICAYVEYTTFQGVDCTPVVYIHPDHVSVLVDLWPQEDTLGNGMPQEARIDRIREAGYEKEADRLTKILGM